MKNVLLTTLLALFAAAASAQTGAVTGRIVDADTGESVVGAVLTVTPAKNPEKKQYLTSAYEGSVSIPSLSYGEDGLSVSFLGYNTLDTTFRVASPKVSLGVLKLKPGVQIETVVKEVKAMRTSQKGDTVSYNAGAFKVTTDADVEGLLKKMPGITVTDGTVEAQGEEIKKIFVDGKEFFGEDVTTAIKSLPAQAVDRVEVYNKLSDAAEFSGMDDGEGYKALNIVTKPGMRQGQFGKLYAGYGYDADTKTESQHKYIAGGNVNIFSGDSRVSVIGLFNNVNQQNFSFEDILGTTEESGSRTSNKNFMVRPLDGISTVQAIGINYSDDWGAKGKVTASYFFNRTDNRNTSQSDRQTFTSTDKLVLYNDENRSKTLNLNHRFNSRIDYKFSDRHSVMMRTSFSLQDNNSRNELRSRTDNKFSDDDIRFVNRRRNFGLSDSKGFNVSNSLIYRYRLPGKKSHNLTFGLGGAYRSYEQLSRPRQYTFRDPDNIECDTSDYSSRNITRTDRDQPGYDVNGNVSYTR